MPLIIGCLQKGTGPHVVYNRVFAKDIGSHVAYNRVFAKGLATCRV